MKTTSFHYSSKAGEVELNIELDDVKKGYHQGMCDDDIAELQRKDYIKKQLNSIPYHVLCSILDDYGCTWGSGDDKEELEGIVLWVACGDILDSLDAEETMIQHTITNIKWETDGENVDLPTEVELPTNIDANDYDAINDYLSDTYGWLVIDYSVK